MTAKPRVPRGYRLVTRGHKRVGDRVWVTADVRGMRRGIWSPPIEGRSYFYRAGDLVGDYAVARPIARKIPRPLGRKGKGAK